jgi:hypothetical protein
MKEISLQSKSISMKKTYSIHFPSQDGKDREDQKVLTGD